MLCCTVCAIVEANRVFCITKTMTGILLASMD